jgi:hypothetical protein
VFRSKLFAIPAIVIAALVATGMAFRFASFRLDKTTPVEA